MRGENWFSPSDSTASQCLTFGPHTERVKDKGGPQKDFMKSFHLAIVSNMYRDQKPAALLYSYILGLFCSSSSTKKWRFLCIMAEINGYTCICNLYLIGSSHLLILS